jgi:adenosylhomocysteine nucleosidase
VCISSFSRDAEALRSGARGLQPARLVTVSRIVATPSEKRRLREQTGADIADMEAVHAHAICETRNIPFLAVKAVSDTADTALSPALVNFLAGGRISPLRAIVAIIRQPSLIREFQRLARDTRTATDRLADALVEV